MLEFTVLSAILSLGKVLKTKIFWDTLNMDFVSLKFQRGLCFVASYEKKILSEMTEQKYH